jgi:hypothetical protein
MTSVFDYLSDSTTQLGTLAWIFFLLQIAVIGAGVYFQFLRQEKKALRKTLLQRLGIALLVLGGAGVLLTVLRVSNVALFTQRYWLYLMLLVEAAFGGYVFYYAKKVYPSQVAASVASRGKKSTRKAAPTAKAPAQVQERNGAATHDHDEETPAAEEAPRSRREARRKRKRKQR